MRDILRISAPLTLWLASFSALYGLHGVICSESWPAGLGSGRVALIVAASLVIGLQLVCLSVLRVFPADQPLVRRIVAILSIAGLVASVWTAVPVFTTSACL